MVKSAVKAVSEIGKDFVFAPFQPMIQPIIHEVLKEHQKDKFRKGTMNPVKRCYLSMVITGMYGLPNTGSN